MASQAIEGMGDPLHRHAFQNPYGLAVGPDGDLHFSDMDNHVIRRIDKRGHMRHRRWLRCCGLSW